MCPRAAPLFGARVDFQRYTSCHDDWLFHFRDNLRLHNEVCRFELRQAGDVARRLALDSDDNAPSFKHSQRAKSSQAKPGGAELKWVLCGKKVFADYPANVDLLPAVEPRRDQLYKIGLPGKSILGDYFQENRTSRRPFLQAC